MRVGENLREGLAEEVRRTISLQTTSADLFETFLATLQLVEPEKEGADTGPMVVAANQAFLREVLANDKLPADARGMAVKYVTDLGDDKMVGLLCGLARANDPELAKQAIRTLSGAQQDSVARLLIDIARQGRTLASLRKEAIMAYAASATGTREFRELLPLLHGGDSTVLVATGRALTSHAKEPEVREAFSQALERAVGAKENSETFTDQLRFALKRDVNERPRNDEQWRLVAETIGDVEAGQLVFFDARASCAKCHRVNGRGGRIGPDLSSVAAAKNREAILASILHPSEEKSPDYQGYLVAMNDGRIFRGTQFHFRGESAEMLLEEGGSIRFELKDVDEYGPIEQSLMPEKLVEALSVSEVRDLMAFLMTLRGEQQGPQVKRGAE